MARFTIYILMVLVAGLLASGCGGDGSENAEFETDHDEQLAPTPTPFNLTYEDMSNISAESGPPS